MKSIKLFALSAILAIGVGTPAFAQDAMMKKDGMMSSDTSMKMSKADMKKMASCKKMSHAMMMRNKGCAKMMKMHPDMMKSG